MSLGEYNSLRVYHGNGEQLVSAHDGGLVESSIED